MVNTDVALNKEDVVVLSLREKIDMFLKKRKSGEQFPKEFCNLVVKPTDEELIIQKESDYTKFEFMELNRKITEHKPIDYAIFSIESQHNYFAKNPIIVNSIIKPGKLLMFDGQNRFEGSRLIRQPIYYLIDNILTEDDLTKINRHQTNWQQLEFVETFAKRGKPFYQYLIELSNKHIEIKPATLIQIINSNYLPALANFGRYLKDGVLVVDDSLKERVNDYFVKLKDFEFYEYYQTGNFISGLIKITKRKNYSHEHMLQKVDNYKEKFYKCVSRDGAFNMLKDVYNMKMRESSKTIK